MSWDDDDAEVVVAVNTAALSIKQKDDEEEDATLKELAAGPKVADAKGPAEPEKVKEKHILKAKEKERAAKSAMEREAALREADEQEAALGENPAERAKRLRELQMKQEMELAAAQFGGSAPAAGGALPNDPVMLLAAVPLTDSDSFTKFGQHVAKRVHEASGTKSLLAMRFYNELLNASADRLSATELTALIRTLETKERQKRDAEKKASGKGKATKAKAAAKVYAGDDFDDGDYDDYEVPAAKPAAGAAAPADVAAKGNVGNVDASVANAGLEGLPAAGGTADGFVRAKYKDEEDFM